MKYVYNSLVTKALCLMTTLLGVLILTAQPSINSFAPLAGPVGTTVVISGSNFDATSTGNTVYFGSAKAVVTAASAASLSVTVPAGGTYEPITVTANGLTGYSSRPFNIIFPSGGFINQNSFRSRTDSVLISNNTGLYGMVLKDFDGDGKNDLATVNGEYYFYVLRNTSSNGIISFAPKQNFYTGGAPFRIYSADFDGDGRPDVATTNFITKNIYVHRNTSANGVITFEAGISYSLGEDIANLSVADFDHDGRSDIIAGTANTLRVYRNTSSPGAISFTLAINFSRPGNNFIVGDWNGDGKPDIAAKDNANTKIEILKNTSTAGTISFANNGSLAGANAGLVTARDLTGDGKPELTVIRTSGLFSFYKNIGNADSISFADPVNMAVPGGTSSSTYALTDADGDGRPDLVYIISGSSNICVLKNKGTSNNISFAEPVSFYARDPSYLVAGDIEGDGKPELIANCSSQPVLSISILKNMEPEPQVAPTGANPVSGNINTKVSVDSTLQSYNGRAYVQRHYDIEPQNDANTATATITLLFTQQDFDSFNAFPNHVINLPANPADNAGKAALRIQQYHGFSATSQPGTYSGGQVEIDPDDDKIVWNEASQCWEITFNVTGFSGFFVGTPATVALPIKIISFTGSGTGLKNVLKWTSAYEARFGFYELERSTDGLHFTEISKVEADHSSRSVKEYNFTDISTQAQVYYYRLKAVDQDGSFTYGEIIKITPGSRTGSLTIYPNPAKDRTSIHFPVSDRSSTLSVFDMAGKHVLVVHPDKNASQYNLSTTGVTKGTYRVIWTGSGQTLSQLLVIE